MDTQTLKHKTVYNKNAVSFLNNNLFLPELISVQVRVCLLSV